MPKMKTKRGAAKRFRLLSSGKIKRKKAYRSHIMSRMSTKRKRHLRALGYVDPADEKPLKRLLPYGSK